MSSHGNEVGSAYVTVYPRTDKFNEELGREVKKSDGLFSGLRNSAGSMIGAVAKSTAVAAAAAATGIGAIAKSSLDSFARNEQLVGGIETLYKDSSKELIKYAQGAYKTAGMSANQYMDTATSFAGSLIQSLEGNTVKAAKYADMAMRDMSDNANKMGTDMGMIQNAYQGFSKQNFVMLDNLKLGYGGTKTEMERLLEDANKLNKEHGKITDYQIDSYADIVDAIHVVQTEMGITGTTAAEASSTIEGSVNSMKGAWDNWLTAVAGGTGDIETNTDELVESVGVAAENIGTRLVEIAGGLSKSIPSLFTQAQAKVESVLPENTAKRLNELIERLGDTFDYVKNLIVESVTPALNNLSKEWDKLMVALEPLMPLFEFIGNIIGATLVLAFNVLIGTITLFIGITRKIAEAVTIVIDWFMHLDDHLARLGNWFKRTWADITASVSNAWRKIVNTVSNGVNSVINFVKNIPNKVKGFFSNAGSWLVSSGKALINGFLEGIKNVPIVGTLSSVMDRISSFFPHSPAKQGAFSGKGWTLYSGQALMEGFAQGALSREGMVTSAMANIADHSQKALVGAGLNASITSGANHVGSLAAEVRALHEELGDIIYNSTPVESTRSMQRRLAYA